jgi:formate hydrogenlyase subunit 6/NADH:ubiquinone oxidoreductase subunit I
VVAGSLLATREAPRSDAVSQPAYIFDVTQLEHLIAVLARKGYTVIGPAVCDGAIVYAPIESSADMPQGWRDEQAPGRYRLERREDDALFGYAIGPQSWKKYLHPAEVRLWSAERRDSTFRILNNKAKPKAAYAFLGVRACELAAIAVQDRVLLADRYHDPIYGERRSSAFLIAVQCTHSAATCFCQSMGTGPSITQGADLILTELLDHSRHCFLAQAASERGQELLTDVKTSPATPADLEEADAQVNRAATSQTRSIDTRGIRELLYQNFEHSRWDHVADRCLTCANCTMVCPTCFCTTVEDSSDVTGEHAERWRRWDSCFTESFSYIHGGSVRTSAKARYRQWITHKLAAWIDQFGGSGCVGCGRCITWCPAGIDITEEIQALRDGDSHGNP